MSRSTRYHMEGPRPDLVRRSVAEALGSGLLLAAVVGSGIMAERLAGGNAAVALLANTIATAAALVALILTFGGISGAHFNPVVSLAEALRGGIGWRDAGIYTAAQTGGGILGVMLANVMFELPPLLISHRVRIGAIPTAAGVAPLVSEFVATFGLMGVILGCGRRRPDAVPFAVGAYIAAAYWFTSSTSFANPAVTIARTLSDTFAGIRPADAPGFIVAQLAGALAATFFFRWIDPPLPARDARIVPSAEPTLTDIVEAQYE